VSRLRSAAAFAGLATRALKVGGGRLRPFKVTLVLTERCDCRCEFCFIWRKKKSPEPTPGEIETLLATAPSVSWVNLTGGELFLRDDVVEVVEAVRRALPHLAVLDFPTTGQRRDRILADVRRIASLGIPRFFVTVSLEGPPDVHDRLRGRAGAFESAVLTWSGLRRIAGVKPYLGMTLSSENAHLLPETLRSVRRLAPEARWRDLHLNVLTTSAHYYGNTASTMTPPAGLDDGVRRVLRARERAGGPTDWIEATYLRLLPAYLATGRSPIACRSLEASVFVAANGDVHPCTVYGRVLGNVRERTLYDILDGEEARAAREVVARDRCPGCWSPCEANPTIVASFPGSLLRRPASHAARRGVPENGRV
jgi:MoaA/NifB/PqqE/SkfB family radical SAM enzyme